jgi:hypothetical protein
LASNDGYTPPVLQTIFHSSAVTVCTDSREYFASAMSASFLSALTAAREGYAAAIISHRAWAQGTPCGCWS